MSRCRFVQPEVVRLYLVDVHRRALQDLEKSPLVTQDEQDTWPKDAGLVKAKLAKAEEKRAADIAALQSRIADAEEDGDYIDVKKELTAGEQRKVFTNLVKTMHAGEKAELDPEQLGTTKIVAYVIGWSFVDANGAPVPFSESALNNLKPQDFEEIAKAIDAHEADVEKARTERKNGKAGSLTPAAT